MYTDAEILKGCYNSSAPQDWERDVKPVEDALRRTLDPNLRIIWNPKAFVSRVGRFDANGQALPPTYDGNYQIVVQGKLDGVDTIVHTIGHEDAMDRKYKPVGPWVVEYMRLWDTANVHRMEEMKRLQTEEYALRDAMAITARERRAERAERFSTDVLGLKPIRSVVPININ